MGKKKLLDTKTINYLEKISDHKYVYLRKIRWDSSLSELILMKPIMILHPTVQGSSHVHPLLVFTTIISCLYS